MLKILLLTDNKAGHESVSNGLIKYIAEKWEIKTTKINSKIRAKFLKKIATVFLNNSVTNKKNILFIIKILYKDFYIDFNKKYDLIISTGGDTAFLNILLSKYFNIPNIYCSSLRGLQGRLFTYLISIVDNNIPNEIVTDFPPIYIETKEKELSGKYLAVLIGGPTKNYKFTDNEFIGIVQKSINLARKMGYKILITTSRRTPLEVEKRIENIYKQNSDIIDKCVLYNQKPQKVINYFLSNADIIFCSEESGSMITESILAKKRLYTIKPRTTNLNKIYKTFIQNIKNKGYIHSIDIKNIEEITFQENFQHIQEKPAKKIIKHIEKMLNEK